MPGGVEVCEEVCQFLVGLEKVRAGQLVNRSDRSDALAPSKFGHGNMLGRAPLG
jgi:hypothetical protein